MSKTINVTAKDFVEFSDYGVNRAYCNKNKQQRIFTWLSYVGRYLSCFLVGLLPKFKSGWGFTGIQPVLGRYYPLSS